MSSAPVIILVTPQLVENIGMSARAMLNCGLSELRIVNPRDPWPLGEGHQQRMANASSGAEEILNNAKIFDTLAQAIADLNYIYATTARPHDMVNRILTAHAAIPDMIVRSKDEQKNRRFVRTGTHRFDQRSGCARQRTYHHSPESRIHLAQSCTSRFVDRL